MLDRAQTSAAMQPAPSNGTAAHEESVTLDAATAADQSAAPATPSPGAPALTEKYPGDEPLTALDAHDQGDELALDRLPPIKSRAARRVAAIRY